MSADQLHAVGAVADIPKALWHRHLVYGVPQQWFVAWLAASLIVVSMVWSRLGWLGLIGAVVLCGACLVYVQHKTREDPQWDEALANDLGQRYQFYYDTE